MGALANPSVGSPLTFRGSDLVIRCVFCTARAWRCVHFSLCAFFICICRLLQVLLGYMRHGSINSKPLAASLLSVMCLNVFSTSRFAYDLFLGSVEPFLGLFFGARCSARLGFTPHTAIHASSLLHCQASGA